MTGLPWIVVLYLAIRIASRYTVHMKSALAFRLSDEARRLLKALSKKLGISMVAVLEMAIREYAAKHEIK